MPLAMNRYRTSPARRGAQAAIVPSRPRLPPVNQHALARSDLSGAMQHLVRRDVVQHEADSLGGVQPGWHRHQFTWWQADELRVRAADRQRGNYLARFDSRDTLAEPIHHANQIPPRREG